LAFIDDGEFFDIGIAGHGVPPCVGRYGKWRSGVEAPGRCAFKP
jgi:hypothetical protein